MGPDDYIETVLTCKGDFYDPEFPRHLERFSESLRQIIDTEKQRIIIKKVEPWNSVRVTFNIPKEAAQRLRHLAEQRHQALQEIGVLAVQIEGDRVISLTIAGRNNERTELVLRTSDAPQTVPSTPMFHPPDGGSASAGAPSKAIGALFGSSAAGSLMDSLGLTMPELSAGANIFRPPGSVAASPSPNTNQIQQPHFMPSNRNGPGMAAASFAQGRNTGFIPPGPGITSPGFSRSPSESSPLFTSPLAQSPSPGPFQSQTPPPPYPGLGPNNLTKSMFSTALNQATPGLLVNLLQHEGAGGTNSGPPQKMPPPEGSTPQKRRKRRQPKPEAKPNVGDKNKEKDARTPRQCKILPADKEAFIMHLDDIMQDVVGDEDTANDLTRADSSPKLSLASESPFVSSLSHSYSNSPVDSPASSINTRASIDSILLDNGTSAQTLKPNDFGDSANLAEQGDSPTIGNDDTKSVKYEDTRTVKLDGGAPVKAENVRVLSPESGAKVKSEETSVSLVKTDSEEQLYHPPPANCIINPYTGKFEPMDGLTSDTGDVWDSADRQRRESAPLRMSPRKSLSPIRSVTVHCDSNAAVKCADGNVLGAQELTRSVTDGEARSPGAPDNRTSAAPRVPAPGGSAEDSALASAFVRARSGVSVGTNVGASAVVSVGVDTSANTSASPSVTLPIASVTFVQSSPVPSSQTLAPAAVTRTANTPPSTSCLPHSPSGHGQQLGATHSTGVSPRSPRGAGHSPPSHSSGVSPRSPRGAGHSPVSVGYSADAPRAKPSASQIRPSASVASGLAYGQATPGLVSQSHMAYSDSDAHKPTVSAEWKPHAEPLLGLKESTSESPSLSREFVSGETTADKSPYAESTEAPVEGTSSTGHSPRHGDTGGKHSRSSSPRVTPQSLVLNHIGENSLTERLDRRLDKAHSHGRLPPKLDVLTIREHSISVNHAIDTSNSEAAMRAKLSKAVLEFDLPPNSHGNSFYNDKSEMDDSRTMGITKSKSEHQEPASRQLAETKLDTSRSGHSDALFESSCKASKIEGFSLGSSPRSPIKSSSQDTTKPVNGPLRWSAPGLVGGRRSGSPRSPRADGATTDSAGGAGSEQHKSPGSHGGEGVSSWTASPTPEADDKAADHTASAASKYGGEKPSDHNKQGLDAEFKASNTRSQPVKQRGAKLSDICAKLAVQNDAKLVVSVKTSPPSATARKNDDSPPVVADSAPVKHTKSPGATGKYSSQTSPKSHKDESTTVSSRSNSPRGSSKPPLDLSFFNSPLHRLTAPIFPFNLTQSVKKVVGPIPSSDKPVKLKPLVTGRSSSPRAQKDSPPVSGTNSCSAPPMRLSFSQANFVGHSQFSNSSAARLPTGAPPVGHSSPRTRSPVRQLEAPSSVQSCGIRPKFVSNTCAGVQLPSNVTTVATTLAASSSPSDLPELSASIGPSARHRAVIGSSTSPHIVGVPTFVGVSSLHGNNGPTTSPCEAFAAPPVDGCAIRASTPGTVAPPVDGIGSAVRALTPGNVAPPVDGIGSAVRVSTPGTVAPPVDGHGSAVRASTPGSVAPSMDGHGSAVRVPTPGTAANKDAAFSPIVPAVQSSSVLTSLTGPTSVRLVTCKPGLRAPSDHSIHSLTGAVKAPSVANATNALCITPDFTDAQESSLQDSFAAAARSLVSKSTSVLVHPNAVKSCSLSNSVVSLLVHGADERDDQGCPAGLLDHAYVQRTILSEPLDLATQEHNHRQSSDALARIPVRAVDAAMCDNGEVNCEHSPLNLSNTNLSPNIKHEQLPSATGSNGPNTGPNGPLREPDNGPNGPVLDVSRPADRPDSPCSRSNRPSRYRRRTPTEEHGDGVVLDARAESPKFSNNQRLPNKRKAADDKDIVHDLPLGHKRVRRLTDESVSSKTNSIDDLLSDDDIHDDVEMTRSRLCRRSATSLDLPHADKRSLRQHPGRSNSRCSELTEEGATEPAAADYAKVIQTRASSRVEVRRSSDDSVSDGGHSTRRHSERSNKSRDNSPNRLEPETDRLNRGRRTSPLRDKAEAADQVYKRATRSSKPKESASSAESFSTPALNKRRRLSREQR